MEILIWIQAVISALLIVSVLLQKGTSGLGTVFGGGVTETFKTKRGFEAFIYNVTIVLGTLFLANSLAIAITTV